MNSSKRHRDFHKTTPSKSVPYQWQYKFAVNKSFFTDWSLAVFTSDRKVATWFCTNVHLFATVTVFILSVTSYLYQNVYKSIPPNIVSWLGDNNFDV